MTYYVNVNRNTIFSNAKNGKNEPPISFQKGKWGKRSYHRIKLKDGEMIYSPHSPILKCVSRLVIITENEPIVVE